METPYCFGGPGRNAGATDETTGVEKPKLEKTTSRGPAAGPMDSLQGLETNVTLRRCLAGLDHRGRRRGSYPDAAQKARRVGASAALRRHQHYWRELVSGLATTIQRAKGTDS